MSHATPAPSAARAWLSAARPATLLAGVVPVVVGTAAAASQDRFAALPALAALAGSILIQIGTNLANDYYDYRAGADGADRLGPPRAAAMGWLSPRQLVFGTAVVLGLALLIGVYLISVGGWPIALLGIASLLLAVGYTGGPFPLAYHGLGDLFVLLFFGYGAVCGTEYVQAGTVSSAGLAGGTAVGLLATAILVVNNLRDRESDARAGKRTLAVRFGARAARVEYSACVALAYAVVLIGGQWQWLMCWLSLPFAVATVRKVWSTDGAPLNPLLGATARLEALFGLLLAGGMLLGS